MTPTRTRREPVTIMDNATNAKQAAIDTEILEALSGKADDTLSELCEAARELEASLESLDDNGLTGDELVSAYDEAAETKAHLAARKTAAIRTLNRIADAIASL